MKFGFVFVPNCLLTGVAGCVLSDVSEFLCREFNLGVFRFRNLAKNN
jgi:hypothetical protein